MALDITTLASTDLLSDSRGDINTNFTNIATDLDALSDDLENLTDGEVTQLEAIGATTISAAQWAYLGDLDQALKTTSNVSFGTLACGAITSTDAGTLARLASNENITGYWTFYRDSAGTSVIGLNVDADQTITGDVTSYDNGMLIDNRQDIDSGHTNTGYNKGVYSKAYKTGLGTLSSLYGLNVQYGSIGSNAGVITTAYGLRIESFLGTATSSIGTNYGIKIENMVGTTKYAIYTGTGDVKLGALAGNAGYYVKVDANGKLYTEAT